MDLLELVREGNHVVPGHRIPQASLGTGTDDTSANIEKITKPMKTLTSQWGSQN